MWHTCLHSGELKLDQGENPEVAIVGFHMNDAQVCGLNDGAGVSILTGEHHVTRGLWCVC